MPTPFSNRSMVIGKMMPTPFSNRSRVIGKIRKNDAKTSEQEERGDSVSGTGKMMPTPFS